MNSNSFMRIIALSCPRECYSDIMTHKPLFIVLIQHVVGREFPREVH